MPYSPTSAKTSVNVQKVYVTLAPLPPAAEQGSTVTFSGSVTIDGSPAAYVNVAIYSSINNWSSPITATVTDGSGRFSASWTVPHGYGCRTYDFKAVALGAESNTVSMAIAYRTRISISAPSSAKPGESISVTGKLEYENMKDQWLPLPGREVYIYLDGSFVTKVTTDSSGNYSATITISAPGTHTIEARYRGEGIRPGAVAGAVVTAVSIPYAPTILSMTPLMTVIALIAWSELRKK
jgi:hypothetical protein